MTAAAEVSYNGISLANADHQPTPTAYTAYHAAAVTAGDANYYQACKSRRSGFSISPLQADDSRRADLACVAAEAQKNKAVYAAAAALPGADLTLAPLLAALEISVAANAALPLVNRMRQDPVCEPPLPVACVVPLGLT